MESTRQTVNLINRFLRKLGFRANCLTIYQQFNRHPLQHSIRSISDLLDSLGVYNIVCQISLDQLLSAPTPSIIIIEGKENPFFILKGFVNREFVVLESAIGKQTAISVSDFSKLWSGFILIADTENKTGDSAIEYFAKQILWGIDEHRGIIIISLYIIMCHIVCLFSNSGNNYAFVCLSLFGLFASIVTIVKPFSRSTVLQNICGNRKSKNCNVVTNPSGTILGGWVSLGELSFAYFLSLSLLTSFASRDISAFLTLISALSMLIVAYSIIWQFFIKTLCVLCFFIDVVLVVSLIVSVLNNQWGQFTYGTALIEFFMFIVIFGLCLFLAREIVRRLSQLNAFNQMYNRVEKILSNGELLSILLRNSECSFSNYDVDKYCPIEYSKSEADFNHRLTIVFNPNCKWCLSLYDILERLKGYKISIFINNNWPNSNSQNGEIKSLQDKFINFSDEISEQMLMLHKEFCVKYSIQHTPAIFIDGKPLPDIYINTDLEYII